MKEGRREGRAGRNMRRTRRGRIRRAAEVREAAEEGRGGGDGAAATEGGWWSLFNKKLGTGSLCKAAYYSRLCNILSTH